MYTTPDIQYVTFWTFRKVQEHSPLKWTFMNVRQSVLVVRRTFMDVPDLLKKIFALSHEPSCECSLSSERSQKCGFWILNYRSWTMRIFCERSGTSMNVLRTSRNDRRTFINVYFNVECSWTFRMWHIECRGL